MDSRILTTSLQPTLNPEPRFKVKGSGAVRSTAVRVDAVWQTMAREIGRGSYRRTQQNVALALLFNGIGVPGRGDRAGLSRLGDGGDDRERDGGVRQLDARQVVDDVLHAA